MPQNPVLARYLVATEKALLRRAVAELDTVHKIVQRVDPVFLSARNESKGILPSDRVWQTRFVVFFKALEPSLDELRQIRGDLKKHPDSDRSMNLLDPPKRATIEHAISDIDFAPNPSTGEDGISYSLPRLREWARELEKWAKETKAALEKRT